jgi:hypothetical protein
VPTIAKSRLWLLGEFETQNPRDLDTQSRGVVGRRLPNERPEDTEILVHQDVPQANDIGPGYRVVPRRNLGAQPRDGFADDRELLCDGIAQRLVDEEFSLCSAVLSPLRSNPTLPGCR